MDPKLRKMALNTGEYKHILNLYMQGSEILMSENLNNIEEQFKSNMEFLINNGNLEEAESLLEEYSEIIPNDIEIYSIKSVILNLQGKIDEAKSILYEGMKKDYRNFDINYNLASIYEQCLEIKDAIIYYLKSLEYCGNVDIKNQIKQNINNLCDKYDISLKDLKRTPKVSEPKIKKVLFIQTLQCIRTYKVAKVIHERGIQVDIIYVETPPDEVYRGLDLPYTNIYKLSNINEMLDFINKSDYDVLYSSNEPDYLTVLFTATNKPVVHDTHDMMSLRGDINNEQVILEYIANKKSHGNVFVTEFIKNIAIKKFGLQNKEIIVFNNYPFKSQLPKKFYTKLSEKDGEIHCVYEGGLTNYDGHHRNIGNLFLCLAKNKIHVHFYAPFKLNFYEELEKKSRYIHYEGTRSPSELLTELTQYDIGLAVLNVTSRNKKFLDTTFPNKVWEYLSAGLPILFSDLQAFRELLNNNKVGQIIDFYGDINAQVNEVLKIEIGKDFLIKNRFTMDDKADEIIEFLSNVKNKSNNKNYNLEKVRNNQEKSLQEQEQSFYDELYKTGGYDKSYFKHYSETLYINSWKKALEIIKEIGNQQIIEIGCGPGQFANMLFDEGLINYKGIDFSDEAIKLAKIRNKNNEKLFSVDNAYTSGIYYENYNIAVLFEILEHTDDDIGIIEKIRKDTNVLFSVPNFNSKSHVRWFNDENEVINRYEKVVDIKKVFIFSISKTNKLYLVIGKRK